MITFLSSLALPYNALLSSNSQDLQPGLRNIGDQYLGVHVLIILFMDPRFFIAIISASGLTLGPGRAVAGIDLGL